MALRPSPPPGGEGFRCMAQNRPGFLLRKPEALRFYGKRLRRCKASVQQRADPCPGGRLGLELIVHLQGGLYTFWLMALLALVAAACLASSVSAAATAAFISA